MKREPACIGCLALEPHFRKMPPDVAVVALLVGLRTGTTTLELALASMCTKHTVLAVRTEKLARKLPPNIDEEPSTKKRCT